MPINLTKNQAINLTKEKPGLRKVFAGLGWDLNRAGGQDVDCDVSVFMLGPGNKVPSDEYFVFYNNRTSPDGSVIHSGDNRTGAGEGDDEVIQIDLGRVASSVVQILFFVVIHEAQERGITFDKVENAFIRIVDSNNNYEICKFSLTDKFIGADTVNIGRLVRSSGEEWEFQAIADPYNGGLQSLVNSYI